MKKKKKLHMYYKYHEDMPKIATSRISVSAGHTVGNIIKIASNLIDHTIYYFTLYTIL